MITLDIVRYEHTVPTRWKNGLGEARQVASGPGHRDAFEWQVSIARMTGKLPFSEYPGIDRSLCIIGGEGLLIASPFRTLTLTSESDPLHFPGEEPIVGATMGSVEMVDFNVLTKRGVLGHRTRRLRVSQAAQVHLARSVTIIFSHSGTLGVSCNGARAELHAFDTALLRGGPGEAYCLSSSTGARCIAADIDAYHG